MSGGGLAALLGCLAFSMMGAISARAQTASIVPIATFDAADGSNVLSNLVEDGKGNFYVATGGFNVSNTIRKVTPDGRVTTIYRFDGDGSANPVTLTMGPDGNLYGTLSFYGGTLLFSSGHIRSIFRLTPTGVLTTLYNFPPDTAPGGPTEPSGPLVASADGSCFYGATSSGNIYFSLPTPGPLRSRPSPRFTKSRWMDNSPTSPRTRLSTSQSAGRQPLLRRERWHHRQDLARWRGHRAGRLQARGAGHRTPVLRRRYRQPVRNHLDGDNGNHGILYRVSSDGVVTSLADLGAPLESEFN